MNAAAVQITPPVSVRRINIVQGEHHVSDAQDVALTTVLGSCIAACLYDPFRGVGGMNHFLLGESGSGLGEAEMRYGAYAMEVLINDLMKAGASRQRLQAKVFGGAKMFKTLNDVGAGNSAFARRFLTDEGIPIVAESIGGGGARRVEFWPASGRVRQREVDPSQMPVMAPARPKPRVDDSIELF